MMDVRAIKKLRNEAARMRGLVVGDLMLDKYILGDVVRIAPEAPIPIINTMDTHIQLGGAGKVIRNLSAAGCTEIHCVGAIGQDDVLASPERTSQKMDQIESLVSRVSHSLTESDCCS